MNLAIIGATGNVGRKTIEILEKYNINFDNLYLVASKNSKGKKIFFKGKEIIIEDLEDYDFSKAEITFFAAGSQIAKVWAKRASEKTIVIDNSSYFRMDDNVPLVIAEVNPEALDSHKNIISNPNCSTMQLVLALKPLHDEYKINRIVVSTYQAVSGAGKESMDELFSQTKEFLNDKKVESKNFTKQIAFNLIPHIDVFGADGYTKEELKMSNETKKILDPNINLTATCVRVPVKTSHAESVNIEFDNLYDCDYTTYISRIRKDNSNKKAINIWVVSDNLLKGAALNTVQIAEILVKKLIN